MIRSTLCACAAKVHLWPHQLKSGGTFKLITTLRYPHGTAPHRYKYSIKKLCLLLSLPPPLPTLPLQIHISLSVTAPTITDDICVYGRGKALVKPPLSISVSLPLYRDCRPYKMKMKTESSRNAPPVQGCKISHETGMSSSGLFRYFCTAEEPPITFSTKRREDLRANATTCTTQYQQYVPLLGWHTNNSYLTSCWRCCIWSPLPPNPMIFCFWSVDCSCHKCFPTPCLKPCPYPSGYFKSFSEGPSTFFCPYGSTGISSITVFTRI